MKKVKTYKIVLIVVILLLVVGITYGFFASQIASGAFSNILVGTSSTDSFTFTKGNDINIVATQANFIQNGGNLEGSTTASAKLIANNDTKTATRYYSVSLDISKNGYIYTSGSTPELMMTVTDPSGAPVTAIDGLNYTTSGGIMGFDITTRKDKIIIKNNKEIVSNNYTTGLTENWTVKVYFINLNSDQQGNTGKEFISSLNINSSEEKVNNGSNYVTLANSNGGNLKDYKIYGNSVQNGTPTPTAPVPVNHLSEKSNVNVTVSGKNLFNVTRWDEFLTKNETNHNASNYKGVDGKYEYIAVHPASGHYLLKFMENEFKENTVYIFNFNARQEKVHPNGATSGFQVAYTDGSFHPMYCDNVTDWKNYTFKTKENKTVAYICLSYFNSGYVWYNNIQLEEGSVSSAYEPYKENVMSISLTGHEPLRKVVDVADYIDFENGRILRNVKKIEVLGIALERRESFLKNNIATGLENVYDIKLNTNDKLISNYFKPGSGPYVMENGLINNEYSYHVLWIRISKSIIGVDNITDLNIIENKYNEWLMLKYNSGMPVTVYYQLETPVYEKIELPNIKTFEGINNIKISDGTMNPSKIDVTYFS